MFLVFAPCLGGALMVSGRCFGAGVLRDEESWRSSSRNLRQQISGTERVLRGWVPDRLRRPCTSPFSPREWFDIAHHEGAGDEGD